MGVGAANGLPGDPAMQLSASFAEREWDRWQKTGDVRNLPYSPKEKKAVSYSVKWILGKFITTMK